MKAALSMCAVLAGAALFLGFLLKVESVVLALMAVVLFYDGGGKNVPLAGSLLMGLCRSLNLLLGASVGLGTAAALAEPRLLLGAGILGLYIAQVTAVSRLEDFEFSRRSLRSRALPLCVFPAGFFFLNVTSWLNGLNSALLAALLAQALLASARSQGGSPTNRPGEPPTNRPGESPTNRPGESPTNRPGEPPTNRPGEPPTNRPGESPTNRPGEPPTNRPGGPLHGAALFVRKALPGLFLVDAGIVLALSPRGVDPWPAFLTLYALFAVAWTWKRSWIRAGAMGS